MKGLLLITFASVLIAVCANSKSASSELETAAIPCKATKAKLPNDKISFEWLFPQKETSSPEDDLEERAVIEDDGTLLIREFTYEDWGKYVCRLKDGDNVIEEIVVDITRDHIIPSDAQRPTVECPTWACLQADKCEYPDTGRTCPLASDACCPTMRESDKHRCKHFLGECMETCHEDIRATRADDCPDGTTCCVLV